MKKLKAKLWYYGGRITGCIFIIYRWIWRRCLIIKFKMGFLKLGKLLKYATKEIENTTKEMNKIKDMLSKY